MDSTEDDLGSFFAEIEQIEEQVSSSAPAAAADSSTVIDSSASPENTATDEYTTSETAYANPAPQVYTAGPSIVAAQVVYSKPAEISTHPVYTYDAPAQDAYYPEASSSSSAFSSSYRNSATSSSSSAPAPVTFEPSNKKFVRKAGGETWVDDTLKEWPENDYRIFVGDLGKEIGTDTLTKHFQMFKSFAKAKVICTPHDGKTKGFGFVSFLDPMDCIKAIREQNGKYLGSRPMTIKRSDWKDRDIKEVKKKDNKKRKLQESLGLA